MPLTRRGTLRLLGLAGIGGISACVQQALTSQSPAPAQSPVSQAPKAVGEQATGEKAGESVDRLAQQKIFAPQRGDVRIVVISDLNSQYGSTEYEPEVDRVIALIPDWQPDLVLCGGDMVAGQKTSLTRSQIQAMWSAFDRHVSAPLRQANIPFGFTIGNHDASGARSSGSLIFAQERDLAAAYWNDPRHSPGLQFIDRAGYPFYYSFRQNDIFFLVWDASTAQIPTEQLAWAERSLASSAAQSAKLRIAIGHLPLYAVAIGRDRPGEYLDQADRLRALLERYRVHTYISGHNHAYFPGYVGNLQTLHAGLLGSGVRQLLNGNSPLIKTATVIDVNLATAETTYTTYDAKTMQVVNQQILPRYIDSPTAKILRRDVRWADLTAAEKESRYVPRS